MKLLIVTYLLIFSTATWAKTVARVSGIEGNSFVFYGKKASAVLKYGDKVADLSEVMVEDGAYVSLVDYHGHTFHLAGGSHVKFYNNMLEVKRGKVWTNSENDTEPFVIQSVNASATYGKGQFVFSFSNYDGKTQLLVMDGTVNFQNILEPELGLDVGPGFFSLVDKEYNQGLPRVATRVGLKSYTKVKLSFVGIEEVENTNFETMFGGKAKRSIASTGDFQAVKKHALVPKHNASGKKGKLYYYSTSTKSAKRTPASASSYSGPAAYYQDYLQKNKKKVYKSGKSLKIKVFGGLDQASSAPVAAKKVVKTNPTPVKVENARTPASIETQMIIHDLNNTFERSLKKQIRIKKRHPGEVNQLIDDLKSYDANYNKSY
jgi:hypothetical protein